MINPDSHPAQKWIDHSIELIKQGKTPAEADAICAEMMKRGEEPLPKSSY